MKMKRVLILLLVLCLSASPALAAMSEMKLPKALKTIGDEAFLGDTAIERVRIQEGTLKIGSRAFADSSAKEIYLPESLTEIADDAFEGCDDVVLFVVRDSYAHEWCIWNNMNYSVLGEEEAVLYTVHSVQLADDAANTVEAIVTTDEACKLKLDLLNDNGSEVLLSKTVDAQEGLANDGVEIAFDAALPASFMLSAVLTDEEGNILCDPCTNRRYTAAYADFENQTAADYPEEIRVDFGDSGFAVLAEDVIRVNAAAEKDGLNYTFASSASLQKGDIIKLYVGGEAVMVKIGSLRNNGDGTITVTEDTDVYLSEIYDVINLETNMVSGTAARGDNIDEKKTVFSKDHAISVGPASLTAHTEMSIRIKFVYDKKKFGENYFDMQLIADTSGKISASLSGGIDTVASGNSPAIEVYNSVVIIPGLNAPAFLNVSVPVNIKADVAGIVDFGFSNNYGFYYNTDDGFTKKERGNSHAEAKIEGKFEIFGGPQISLTMSLFGKVSAVLSGNFGATVTGVTEKVIAGGNTADINTPSIHACQGCIDCDIFADAYLDASLKYKLTKEVSGTILDLKIAAYREKLFDAYYSYKNDPESIYGGEVSYAMTECMNHKYRVIGRTIAMNGEETSGVPVTFSGTNTDTTTKNSPHKIYLYKGDYTALADFDSGEVEMKFNVDQNAISVILEEKEMILEGYVTDAETDKPISGAKVVLVMPNGKTKTTTTNSEGYYRFDMLPGGTFTIQYSAYGYFTDSYENMTYVAGTRNRADMTLESSMLMDEEIVRKLMDYMGPDLIKRLKAADIDLSLDFDYYVPIGEKPTYKHGQMAVSVELRSACLSTWPTFKLDTDLYYEAQCAIYDSGIFNLTDEEIAEFKEQYYDPNSSGRFYADIYTDSGINLHISQTPSYEAITFVRPTASLKNDTNECSWWSGWSFDEMQYASANRP